MANPSVAEGSLTEALTTKTISVQIASPRKSWRIVTKEYTDIIQPIVTIAALIIGGYWTFHVTRVYREGQQHLNSFQDIQARSIDQNRILLSLNVRFENKGKTLITLGRERALVELISPITSEQDENLKKNTPPLAQGDAKIEWPLLCYTSVDKFVFVEPEETDTVSFDFILPSGPKVLRIHSELWGKKQIPVLWGLWSVDSDIEKNRYSWQSTTTYDLPKDIAPSEVTGDDIVKLSDNTCPDAEP